MNEQHPRPKPPNVQAELERARRMLADQQRLTGLGSWERDLETGEVTWSDELFRIHGFEPGTVTAASFAREQATVPEDRARQRAWAAAVLAAAGAEVSETVRLRRRDGEIRTLRLRAAVVSDAASGHRRVVGTAQDITEQARAREAEVLLGQIFDSALEPIITVDPARVVTSWNPAAERLYGYTAREMIGSDMRRLLPDELGITEDAEVEERNWRLLNGESENEDYETRRRCKDGTVLDVEIRWSPLRDAGGTIIGTIVSARDISERKRQEARASHLHTHDPLTGLLNRHGFEEALEQATATGLPGALVLLDLDNFKYVNETHGHKLGDALVAELAVVLARQLRAEDVLARLGGDEFAVITSPATLEQGRGLGEALREAVHGHALQVEDDVVSCTASIGVTSFRGSASSAAELLADVDRAMYVSKEGGRDRVTAHTESDRARARQSAQGASEHMIRSALSAERFELFVQPVVNLTSGLMTHCEVLLRLRAEHGELISPGEFLPAAERLGLIHLVDRWVIERALAAAAEHPDLTFEINLSGATIDDQRLESFIARQLKASGPDPHRIVFELTETAAVGNIGRARDLAAALSELGCRFAIDDFGAGFSTFYYLKHFPAKYVKIDGEFMKDPGSRVDELVIESIVRICRNLGKLTVAEYVSDAAAMERVRALGVDYGQGFFFSKPFPIAELAAAPRRLLAVSQEPSARPLYARSAQTFT